MNNEPVTATVERGEGRVVVRVSGEVDMATAPVLAEALDRAFTGGDPARVVVDLTGVSFFASSGLALLAQTSARARDTDTDVVVVVAPGGPTERAITVTSMDRSIRVVHDLAGATSDSA
ncbi:Anti-sigma F factor antagonist (spoIIAA-2) [Actinokineospora spheciospongiae]|uniref:Anti-sigma factor antagonist n=1 Tax=Actinokineospora spheciospongiae TaxID=909613 RepID=W7IYW7_9PSEU|nr:STAS domain-containing protein [Actinokineospora spheciospongiae]EWC59229.1 Anti-sigma F factor antagonist (spoIIAA-2) [Actinokineospora spheciospongiae]